jgi:hypothetical protein
MIQKNALMNYETEYNTTKLDKNIRMNLISNNNNNNKIADNSK